VENGAGPALAHLVEPMLAGMTTTRQHLLAWVHAHGLAALDELFGEEAVVLAGAKGRSAGPAGEFAGPVNFCLLISTLARCGVYISTVVH